MRVPDELESSRCGYAGAGSESGTRVGSGRWACRLADGQAGRRAGEQASRRAGVLLTGAQRARPSAAWRVGWSAPWRAHPCLETQRRAF